MRVLLVEDDELIGGAIREALSDASMSVDWVQDGRAALAAASDDVHALVLLDLGLPKQDGLSVLRSLRQKRASIPVIIITARDALEDRIAGLDLGADDYLVKPFPVDELMARMRAVLHALILRPGQILSRSELEDRVYGWNEEVASNAIEFLIHAIRKKLGQDAIKNVRGLGWMVPKS